VKEAILAMPVRDYGESRAGEDLRRRRHIQSSMIECELALGWIENDLHLNSRYYKNDRAAMFANMRHANRGA
jgi:hypothetical protein